jgi:hypothetical protein
MSLGSDLTTGRNPAGGDAAAGGGLRRPGTEKGYPGAMEKTKAQIPRDAWKRTGLAFPGAVMTGKQ